MPKQYNTGISYTEVREAIRSGFSLVECADLLNVSRSRMYQLAHHVSLASRFRDDVEGNPVELPFPDGLGDPVLFRKRLAKAHSIAALAVRYRVTPQIVELGCAVLGERVPLARVRHGLPPDDELRTLITETRSIAALARKLNTDPATLHNQARRLGVTRAKDARQPQLPIEAPPPAVPAPASAPEPAFRSAPDSGLPDVPISEMARLLHEAGYHRDSAKRDAALRLAHALSMTLAALVEFTRDEATA